MDMTTATKLGVRKPDPKVGSEAITLTGNLAVEIDDLLDAMACYEPGSDPIAESARAARAACRLSGGVSGRRYLLRCYVTPECIHALRCALETVEDRDTIPGSVRAAAVRALRKLGGA